MKVIKSLLLGSAAFLAVGAAAQAADLPSRKSAPAEYVKICDAYGAGYFYIPGSDTCLRVGGLVRAEYAYIQANNVLTAVTPSAKFVTPALANSSFVPSGTMDTSGFLARGRLDLDARTQSPYGTVRTFVSVRVQNTSGAYADNYTTGAFTGQSGTTGITLENALVQFAGFTFGRTNAEIFSFMPGSPYNAMPAAAGYPPGVNVIDYTATFGGGFSASIGLEDKAGFGYAVAPAFLGQNYYSNGGVPITSLSTNAFVNGPETWPSLAANVRWDQSWGAVQVMGHVIQNSASFNNGTAVSAGGAPNFTLTQIGWAVGAGLKLNLPMLAAGDTLYATAAYANGDIDQIAGGAGTDAVTANGGRGISGFQRVDRNLYVYNSSVAGACGSSATTSSSCFKTEQTTGWSAAAYFTHYWTPTVRSVFLASYLALNPGNVTKNLDWTQGGLSNAQIYYGAAQLVWSPVKDLDIGAELSYARLNQRFASSLGTAGPTAQTVTNVSAGGSVWEGRLRVARSF